MLQAQLNNGTLIVLATLMREEIEQFRKSEKFYCPICKERVMIKAGKKIIPHFAHWSKNACIAGDRGEGIIHEQGKLLLYEWFKKQRIDVQLEKYLREIKQRPDLFVTINDKKVAIEYQCARVSIDQIYKRNQGYIRAGITPIWILGPSLFHQISSFSIKIDDFTKQFIHRFSSKSLSTLYYLCPKTNQFAIFQDIYFKRKGQAIGNLAFIPILEANFKHLFQSNILPKNILYRLWAKEKTVFRLQRPSRVYGYEKKWIEWLYYRHTHRELLPSAIYLPIISQHYMKSPLWNWQSRLCIDLIEKLSTGAKFSAKNCEQLLRGHFIDNDYYPLFHPTETAITEYLQHIETLRFIKQIAPNEYIKTNSFTFHKNIEDAIISDKILMNEMIQNSETNYEHNVVNVRYTK